MNSPATSPFESLSESVVAKMLDEIIHEASSLLPEQAPLHAFVHHNTLHAFEHLSFEDAVTTASEIFGTEPFQLESDFADHISTGRIDKNDVAAVVASELAGNDSELFGGMSQVEFFRERLLNLFPIPSDHALRHFLEEGDAFVDFESEVSPGRQKTIVENAATPETAPILRQLWRDLAAVAFIDKESLEPGVRARDRLLQVTGVDTDELVHPLLIRLSAAFLDQGVAYWPMPGRELGFLEAFRKLYMQRGPPPDRPFLGLARILKEHDARSWNADATIQWAFGELGIVKNEWKPIIENTLLSLRGWAGMMHHLEHRPDRAPVKSPPASLKEFLAVKLILDVVVAKNTSRRYFGSGDILRPIVEKKVELSLVSESEIEGLDDPTVDASLVYESFVLAQRLPVPLDSLHERARATQWVEAVRKLGEVKRRWLLHLAYEHHHRVEVLDGISAHCNLPQEGQLPEFQAAFCIDDREESLRRHLEECHPAVSTYGYAGFYGVAMNYQGMEDIRPRPLCPVSIQPKHLIVEEIVEATEASTFRSRKRLHAMVSNHIAVGSSTLTRGSLASLFLGTLTLIPIVLRSIFPHAAMVWSHAFDKKIAPRPKTRLNIECTNIAKEGELQRGYTTDEMTTIVLDALQTMSLVKGFCPIVLIVGHGSSSLNNPHEAAHDCGATGGGHGGSNARAFAAMANHKVVRSNLLKQGISISDGVWFVGAFHNTCDDSMTYYDEDLVPAQLQPAIANVKMALTTACTLDAHERCRRFETAPATLKLDRAMVYAETHAEDLAEPRPEYGHATNAVCIVGRRERTRNLFLDRRAFLVSYDPTTDPAGEILAALLLSVGPVGAGINLEYYFSFVDRDGYGSGTKLPHNITGLIGVMDGHATDLRTGLPWQMVEIHEPVRLLTIVEAEVSVLEAILAREPALARLIQNGWIQFVAWDPSSEKMHVFEAGKLRPYEVSSTQLSIVENSAEFYSGKRYHLPPAHIRGSTSC